MVSRSQTLSARWAHCHWDVIASRLSLWIEVVFSCLSLPCFQLQTLTVRDLAPIILNIFTYLLSPLYENTLLVTLDKSPLFLCNQSCWLSYLDVGIADLGGGLGQTPLPQGLAALSESPQLSFSWERGRGSPVSLDLWVLLLSFSFSPCNLFVEETGSFVL